MPTVLQDFSNVSSLSDSQLTEEEALQLANELSLKLSDGEKPGSDAEKIAGEEVSKLTGGRITKNPTTTEEARDLALKNPGEEV